MATNGQRTIRYSESRSIPIFIKMPFGVTASGATGKVIIRDFDTDADITTVLISGTEYISSSTISPYLITNPSTLNLKTDRSYKFIYEITFTAKSLQHTVIGVIKVSIIKDDE